MKKIWMFLCLLYWCIRYPDIVDEILEDKTEPLTDFEGI